MTVLGIDPGIRKMCYGLINIHKFNIKIIDHYGNIIEINEMKIFIRSYEKFNNLFS